MMNQSSTLKTAVIGASAALAAACLYNQFGGFRLLSEKSRQKWKNLKHITTVTKLTRESLDEVIKVAEFMQKQVKAKGAPLTICNNNILGCLFYEPSTRTMCSFQAAIARLGGSFLTINDVKNSSVAKGETLEDTIKCLSCYCDAIAIRHSMIGAADTASTASGETCILNAGDGAGEHPTQALLDLYTIWKEKGRLRDLNVVIIGDLKHGRTVHSLAKLLSMFEDIRLTYVCPDSLKLPAEVYQYVANGKAGVTQRETADLTAEIANADVLYVTRIQKERFAKSSDYDSVKNSFLINAELLKANSAKPDLTIMHPLPRVNEISTDIDEDTRRAAYFRQMENGMYVRMALLAMLLGKKL